MTPLGLQMSTNDPAFWVMVVVAASFFTIAVAMIFMAVFVSRAVKSVNRLEADSRAVQRRLGSSFDGDHALFRFAGDHQERSR